LPTELRSAPASTSSTTHSYLQFLFIKLLHFDNFDLIDVDETRFNVLMSSQFH